MPVDILTCMGKINSRAKGARYEREIAKWFREELDQTDARRGQQFSGGTDSPDVVNCLEGIHWELKHVESLNVYKAMQQAIRDCGQKVPAVIHRRNNVESHVTVRLQDLVRFARQVTDSLNSEQSSEDATG